MTKEEAVKIAGIIKTADGGCRHCYYALADRLQDYFPEFIWRNLVKTSPELWSKEEIEDKKFAE